MFGVDFSFERATIKQTALSRHIYYMDVIIFKIWRFYFYLREFFFPQGCSICQAELLGINETWYGLCCSCQSILEYEINERLAEKACSLCGKPLISEHGKCLSCRNGEKRSYDRATVLFPYAGKYRALLAAYKFGGNLALGNFFTEKIVEIMRRGIFPQGVKIVPVPPRPGKIRSSGWDQIEYLAKLLEKRLKGIGAIQVIRCLKRLPSMSQKELGKENRRVNLLSRIMPVKQAPKISVLIDDVMTTGSTLDACAAALKKGGSNTVYGLCLFYD